MKKLSILFLFSLIWIGVQAQPFTLKGQVNDPNGTPIANAKIMVADQSEVKTQTDAQGLFLLRSDAAIDQIVVTAQGFQEQRVAVNGKTFLTISMQVLPVPTLQKEIVIEERALAPAMDVAFSTATINYKQGAVLGESMPANFNTESYAGIEENGYQVVTSNPLSTFSIDVDRASYSNVRRFLNQGSLPPKDAVRVEELINYFDYDYPDPSGDHPIAVHTELTQAPWDEEKQLLHIGVQAERIDKEDLPPSNLVFLIDVSGSMRSPNKLPLLKSSLNMLVDELREDDRVALVVYAGAAGLVLESTPGSEKDKIKSAINALEAGGSTAGGAGIQLAYQEAQANFMKRGNNRVILASDGDFNVGASSDGEMQRLIEAKREAGVYLTVLGFGMGNYKDSKMETLADHGNGNYAYIDNLSEARKTLIGEFGATLFTVAKDVKIQVEFNPAVVAEYRLIGYENRLLDEEDFNDDKKDAGEMGAGHTVTAIYELIPAGAASGRSVDPLRYQSNQADRSFIEKNPNEVALVKVRYKKPEASKSTRIEHVVDRTSKNLMASSKRVQWSASIAAFGMKLRAAESVKDMSYDAIIELASGAISEDPYGYRSEAVQLMRNAAHLTPTKDMP